MNSIGLTFIGQILHIYMHVRVSVYCTIGGLLPYTNTKHANYVNLYDYIYVSSMHTEYIHYIYNPDGGNFASRQLIIFFLQKHEIGPNTGGIAPRL